MIIIKEVRYFNQQNQTTLNFFYSGVSLVIHQRKFSNDIESELTFYLNSFKNWPAKLLDKNVEVLQIIFELTPNCKGNRNQTISLDVTEEIYQITSLVFTYYSQKKFHYPIDKVLDMLVDRILSISKERQFKNASFRELLEFMEKNVKHSISRKGFGDALHMSSSSLDRLSKKYVRLSTRRLFLEMKCTEAERKLRETTLPIKTIGEDLGFKSSKQFSTQFKKVTGKSPAEVRKSRRK